MDHHPHIHALVPGGGPSLDGSAWTTTKHPTQKNRRKPFLTDNEELGKEFRMQFIAGLRRLIKKGKLRLEDKLAELEQEEEREAWLGALQATDWNVFVEGPPNGRSKPEHVLKYLARYISGGPIADSRLISDEDDKVTFWARTRDKANKSEPFTLRGSEFVRRWSMHILPKGYTRSRSYGGFHSTKRKVYLAECRRLLPGLPDSESELEVESNEVEELLPQQLPKCPSCKVEMTLVSSQDRPSWNDVFTVEVYRDPYVYCPLLHFGFGLPAAFSIGGYG